VDEELLREVTGLELESSGHALLGEGARVRSTQRLALGDVGSGIVAFTWPAELQPQAQYLYQGDRARRLLVAAGEDGWDVEPRPHLAFWLSSPEVERGYASQEDEPELGSFIARLKRKKRAAHLRPGLRLRCKWSRDEAAALFEQLLTLDNGLGLYSEDILPDTREQSGNFPQTYSHVGLINAAFKLSRGWD
jgi:hypothetical protein